MGKRGSGTMQELNGYSERYLKAWETHCTLRSLERYAVDAKTPPGSLYPDSLQPLYFIEEGRALSDEAKHFIQVQSFYQFMEFVAITETDIVVDLCSRLANDDHGVEIPPAARQVALTVATDEVYHAYVAREYIDQVTAATGIAPLPLPGRPALVDALAWARSTVPAEALDGFEIIALCLAENTLTEEVLGITKETEPDNPFHRMAHEHFLDEGRHQPFFRRLLRYFWSALDEDTKCQLSPVLAGYIDQVWWLGAKDKDRQRSVLIATGMDENQASALIDKLFGHFSKGTGHPVWRHQLSIMRSAGVLDHEPTHAALKASGWLDEPRPAS